MFTMVVKIWKSEAIKLCLRAVLFHVNNRNTIKGFEKYSELAIKTLKLRH